MTEMLAVPTIVGLKTVRERFAGATHTYSLEGCMRDRKALQMGTSHELGQNFAKAFGIEFSDADGQRQLAWTTSWGTSTRMVGGLIMVHGDDSGLRLPPRLAPVQVLVVAVKDTEEVMAAAQQLVADLKAAGVRVRLDDRTDLPFGRRAVDAELKGMPLRLEVGPRDLKEEKATLVRRIAGPKDAVPLSGAVGQVLEALTADQDLLFNQARELLDSSIADVKTLDEVPDAAAEGWARIPWDQVGAEGEEKLNGQAITVRCLVREDGSVPESESEPGLIAYAARAY